MKTHYELAALERAVTMLREMARKAETAEDPYGGLFYSDDADVLESLLKRLRGDQE